MFRFVSVFRFVWWFFAAGICGVGFILAAFFLYLTPNLPDVEQLRQIQLQTPLRIFSADHQLIAEFGEKRRTPITISETPEKLIQAFIAAEDNRFLSHHGVDIKGLTRAAMQLITTGRIQSGGSTITMQVAKNFFLTREKTFTRKFNEILLALKIENSLSKAEILELYVNKIYLGNRAYGIQAAAQVYYGKNVTELNLAEMAMIAGLPKAPSAFNPIANPERARIRRDWILDRMLELQFIDQPSHQTAQSQPVIARYHGSTPELEAPYLAEMARKEMVNRFGESAYTDGYHVFLTIEARNQRKANEALRRGLHLYDQRHGYRGPLATIPNIEAVTSDEVARYLASAPVYGDLELAVVLRSNKETAELQLETGTKTVMTIDSMKWAAPYQGVNSKGKNPQGPDDVLKPGDIVYVVAAEATADTAEPQYLLTQLPEAQSALVSIRPVDGALVALSGGYDFNQSKFNRAIQAARQPGSNFKPFVYLAALEQGSTAATLINDAPIIFEDEQLETEWRPENSSGKFYGPTRLRQALYKSRNLVSIRLLKKSGIQNTVNYVSRFGFDKKALPKDLSLALGSAGFTPFDIAKGYAEIANGGYAIEPYFIDRIVNADGETIFTTIPRRVCHDCDTTKEVISEQSIEGVLIAEQKPTSKTGPKEIIPESSATMPSDEIADQASGETTPEAPLFIPAERIADERAVFIMHSMLQDVIKKGTGRRAKALGRNDLAGKTGTTNDQKDAWFSGFNSDVATTVWVGFDQPQTLGRREFGATAALPIWIDFMKIALEGKPDNPLKRPEGIVTVRIDPVTGKRASVNNTDAIFEVFREEFAPEEEAIVVESPDSPALSPGEPIIPEQIF